VFARTRHHYDSYDDFWRLVELSGFPTCWVDEIDLIQRTLYITTPINGEQPPHLRAERARVGSACPGRVLWWLLERPDATGRPCSLADQLTDGLGYCDAVCCSDKLVASLDPRLHFLAMGSHPELAPGGLPARLPPDYHVAHISYAWGRREAIYNALSRHGLKVAPGCWGTDRDRMLRRSRLLLNLQQYTLPVVAPLRFAVAAAYKIPLVTERVHDAFPLLATEFSQAPYEQIVDHVRGLLRWAGPDLDALGDRLYQRLCLDWTFRHGVEELLSHLEI
jgi:hypothetical protein